MTRPDSPTPPAVIVVGASVRALAASARRAGWSVHAADLFADADLRALATTAVRVPTTPTSPWPDGLPAALQDFPRAPWMYAGALENRPDLVDRLAGDRPLAGNAGDRLRAVRDPALLARVCRGAGIAYPDTFADAAALPGDGSFLVKPRASAGGRGIARWRGGDPSRGATVWQRFVPGRPWSLAFVLDAGGARLFGASRQLIGRGWCGARGFAYCGSIDAGGTTLPAPLRVLAGRLGAVLAHDFGLVGLVGVDVIVAPTGGAHVIEINPRPTASMELVERATGASVAATHLGACGFPALAPPTKGARRMLVWAKAVVFADRAGSVDACIGAALAGLSADWSEHDGGWPALADLPAVGTALAAGRPALTVFASGPDAAAAFRALRGRTAAVRAVLRAPSFNPPGDAAGRPPVPPARNTA